MNAQAFFAGRLPLSSVVQLPVVLSLVSSNLTVRLLLGGKLLPLSVTVLPATPAVKLRLMPGPTVKSTQAECSPSDTFTLWDPALASGTLNPQGPKLPLRSVLQCVETLWPSKVTVTVSFASKPLPVTAARSPTAPSSEVSSTDAMTLKRVESENPLSSIAVTLWLPPGASGTSNS